MSACGRRTHPSSCIPRPGCLIQHPVLDGRRHLERYLRELLRRLANRTQEGNPAQVAVQGPEERVRHDLDEGAAVRAFLLEPRERAVGLAAECVEALLSALARKLNALELEHVGLGVRLARHRPGAKQGELELLHDVRGNSSTE